MTVKQPAVQVEAVAAGPKVVNINRHNIAFDITTLAVKAGEPVRFVFANGSER